MTHSKEYEHMRRKLGVHKKGLHPGSLLEASKSFKHHKERKPKPTGKGIVKALGQKGTTGNFAKIQKAEGKGAAIGALQNKLAARRGKPAPFHRKHHKSGEPDFKKHKEVDFKHHKMACKKDHKHTKFCM